MDVEIMIKCENIQYQLRRLLNRSGFLRNVLILTIMFVTLILSTGCSNLNSEEAENNSVVTSKIKDEKFEIYENSFLAENLEEDLDGDGVKETIKMYIHPSPIMDGENEGQYLWDDSHFWQLIVFDEDKTYPLYNNQLSGKLKFWIDGDEEQKTIILLQDGMELSLETFKYDVAGYFMRKELYKSTEIPPVRSTRIQ